MTETKAGDLANARLKESRTDVEIVYRHGNGLYVNLTSRCRLKCTFCFKVLMGDYPEHHLVMSPPREPSVDEVIRLVEQSRPFAELVFCGLGEPLERLDAVLAIARHFHVRGDVIRLNTDGLLYLAGSRRDLEALAQCVDQVSISLNAPDAHTYNEICRPPDPERAFACLLEFIRDARQLFREARVSVVDLPGLDLAACRRLAASLDVKLSIRPFVPGAVPSGGGGGTR